MLPCQSLMATISLHLGAPIETVSKLLGHTEIRTTEIYAEVLDESKKKAVALQGQYFQILNPRNYDYQKTRSKPRRAI